MNELTLRKLNLTIIFLVLFTFTPTALIHSTAQAAMVDSQMIDDGENASLREINEKKVRRALENKIVAEKLKGHGLSAEEVSEKLATMSDKQVHQIASLSDRIPAGGDGATAVIITVLVIVALVLLIIFLWKRV